MNYGWGNIQPNQPPNGYYPPVIPAYPTTPGISAPGFGFPSGAGDGGMGIAPGSAYGAPHPSFGNTQPPFGAPQPSFGANQLPFGGQALMPGPANTESPAIGFGALFNNLAQAQTPQHAPAPVTPSAPPMPDSESIAPEPMNRQPLPVEAGRRVNIVVVPSGGRDSDSTYNSAAHFLHPDSSDSDVRPRRPENPPYRRSPSPCPNADSGASERRNDSRYQEGLKNMADLMTDVDINDDVLKSLKSKFNL